MDQGSATRARLDAARSALQRAEQANAVAILADGPPPYSADQVRELEYAVADIAEELYGGDLLAVGPRAQRLVFPAAG